KISYLTAVSGLDVQAAVPFYGGGIGRRLGEAKCPLLAFFGGRDEWVSNEEIEMVKAHHPGQVVVYPEAPHGFMRDGSDTYRPEAAADAWRRMLEFFAKHLGS